MKKFILPLFVVMGALDFVYGVAFGDRISMIAGGAIAAITIYIWKKKVRGV